MASIEDQLKNVRTLEDIVNILAILFNNMNSISRVYYDIFLNAVPMLVPVKLYDDNGVLQDREIPNVAYYKSSVLTCKGSPEGVQSASQGALCIDTLNNDLYYKAVGTDEEGWRRIYCDKDVFLTPTGNAQDLKNLNMDSATLGILSVLCGGTGVGIDKNGNGSLLNGLVKANGTNPFSEALPDSKYEDNSSSDYIDPAAMVGVVSYYAGNVNIKADEPTIVNGGWFVCNGKAVSKAQYPRLHKVIGYTYGSMGEEGEYFLLPNLIGNYIKGSESSTNEQGSHNVGRHTHLLSEATTGPAGAHTHNRGTMNITGGFQGAGQFKEPTTHGNTDLNNYEPWGAFKCKNKRYKVGNKGAEPDWYYEFDASANWTGETSEAPNHTHSLSGTISYNKNPSTGEDAPEENDVNHIKMIPIIKF